MNKSKLISAVATVALLLTYAVATDTTMSVTVGNEAPAVGTITISPDELDLTACGTAYLTCTAAVTDSGGHADISGGTHTAALVLEGSQESPDYTNSSCTYKDCTGNTCNLECVFGVDYYKDETTTGECNITLTDVGGLYGTNNTNIVDVNKLLAHTLANTPILFGNLNPGTTDNPAQEGNGQPINQTNCGNVEIDAQLSGTDLVGESDDAWIIAAGNVTYYGSDDAGSSVALTGTPATLELDTSEQSTGQIWNWIDIPTPLYAQAYSGNYTVTAAESV